jgi:RNA polymerase sigma-70 factor, ECF subfamily
MPMEDEAVTQLYREHAGALRRFVLAAMSNPDQAEDVVQETILRVWRRGADPENLRGYLYEYRRRSRRVQEAGELQEEPAAADQVDKLLLRVLMEEALRRLSPEHRNVILVLHYQRLTAVDAAKALNIPLGTVKSRAFYAVRALRAVLDEMGVEP